MKPKPKYDYLRAQAMHGRRMWPPMAQAKGVQAVAARKPGPVTVLGNAQALEVNVSAKLGTFSRIRHVGTDGVARNPGALPNVPRIDGGIPVVEKTQFVREPTAQRQIVQAAAGHSPNAVAGRRLPAGVNVRMLGAANREIPASAVFYRGGKHVQSSGPRAATAVGIRQGKAPQGATAGDATGGARDGQQAPDSRKPATAVGEEQAPKKEG